jgi:glycosyltransferase involved in cell wall biosynthesis
VPLYNEEESVGPLVTRVHEALAGYPQPWELLLVDDGSSDATAERIDAARRHYGDHVRAVNLVRNFKQTAAMQAVAQTKLMQAQAMQPVAAAMLEQAIAQAQTMDMGGGPVGGM